MYPIETKSYRTEINGQDTDFVFTRFPNKCLLIVTQYQKIVNVMVASNDNDMASEGGSIGCSVQSKFGMDTDEVKTAIQRIIQGSQLGAHFPKSDIIVSLGLKDKAITKATLDEIIDSIRSHILAEGSKQS